MIIEERMSNQMLCPMGQAHPTASIRCAGKECMAWRFEDPPRPQPGDRRGFCGFVYQRPGVGR